MNHLISLVARTNIRLSGFWDHPVYFPGWLTRSEGERAVHRRKERANSVQKKKSIETSNSVSLRDENVLANSDGFSRRQIFV
jgi:transcription initiation factor TFIID subunit TAF12